MDVYYLFNSGFSIECGDDCMIIDYYTGKLSDKWKMPTARAPESYKSVSVLSSHSHGDHFVPEIFSWAGERPDIKYLLSSDISEKSVSFPDGFRGGGVEFISDGETREINGFTVRAYGSTDIGISFHIVRDGLSMFHAGDLNYWHWANESTADEIAEAGELFAAELSRIRKGVDSIDVAFFPVDPRMKTDYYRGAVLFCMEMKPKVLVPMHFGRYFSPPREFLDEVLEYTEVRMPDNGRKGVKIEIEPGRY